MTVIQNTRHTSRYAKGGKEQVQRISISLPPKLLDKFDRSMENAGFKDRSKSIQTALHSFINENDWKYDSSSKTGAGAIIVLYDSHTYNQDTVSTRIQHRYGDVISATTHLHLEGDNCLESIMVKGNTRRIKELAKGLSKNRGIKTMKVHFISFV
jgi:CopG family transcriptional regulator, nickel-responsive regulator